MKNISLIFLIILFFISCKTDGVTKSNQAMEDLVKNNSEKSILDSEKKNLDTKDLGENLWITWHEHGTGDSLETGDVIMIDYKVRLKDSSIVDGNHLLKKASLPFVIGFQMQTLGWDKALKHMAVGDFATIKIPSPLARGEKGIKNLIPPNADNWLTIRILEKKKPTRLIDDVKVWVLEENTKNKVKFSENKRIIFHTTISSESNPYYFNSYASNQEFELKLEDNGVVPGLKKSLINAKKADRMFVYVPAKEAYAAKGYQDLVKPNEDLFYNILVMDVLDK